MVDYRTTAGPVLPWPSRLTRYQRLLFADVVLRDRSVLDVGGGNGVMSFYAASQGARRVVCLEPAGAGSNAEMLRQFQGFAAAFDPSVQVERREERLQDLTVSDGPFDVVLLHNVVNHLDEAACARLTTPSAQARYLPMFQMLHRLGAVNGDLIIADCGRRNLWGDLGLPNVFAPTINWRIHQQPMTWARLLEKTGFNRPRCRWDAPSRLGRVGQLLLGNGVGGYLTNSHFILTMKRVENAG